MAGRRAAWGWVLLLAVGVWQAGCGGPTTPGSSSFTWSVSPSVLTVQKGSAGTFTIRLDSKVNINSDVAFSLSGNTPPNSTTTFSPQRLPSTGRDATLTFQTSSQTPEGAYSFTVTATEVGLGAHDMLRRVDVVSGEGPDFTLEVDPPEATLSQTSAPTITFFVRPRNGFLGTVDITVEGITAPPAPLVLSQPPLPPQIVITNAAGAGGTFVVRLADRPSYPPTVSLTVRAVSGSIVHTRELAITIRP